MKFLLTLIALLLAFGFAYASEHEWLKESLKDVAQECSLVEKDVRTGVALLNIRCPEH